MSSSRHRLDIRHVLGIFSLVASVAATAVACGPTAERAASAVRREVPTYDVETFYDTTAMGGASFSADGTRLLVSSDERGVFNVYSQPVAGGEAEMLTRSADSATFAVSWFPRDDRFLYTADRGGDELDHIYVREEDGTVVDLTPGEDLKAEFVGCRTT